MNESICETHKQPISHICAVQKCNNNKICKQCTQNESIHVTKHANYILTAKQFQTYCAQSDDTINKVQIFLTQSQKMISQHKRFYHEQINYFNKDFDTIIQKFKQTAQKFRKLYYQNFQKQMKCFDQDISNMKTLLKEYITQRSQQQSFFNFIFGGKQQKNQIQDLIKKHWKIFKVRGDIIALRSDIVIRNTNRTYYKPQPEHQKKLKDIISHMQILSNSAFSLMNQLLVTQGSSTVKSTIFSQTKSLNHPLSKSQASFAKKLSESQVSITRNRQLATSRVLKQQLIRINTLPNPHPQTIKILNILKPLQFPPGLAIIENKQKKQFGMFKYQNGFYSGEMKNGLRHGIGNFVFLKDGSKYEGTWIDDYMSGYGRLITNNSYYQGYIEKGKANGNGTFQNSFWIYAGEWKDDKKHGIGQLRLKPNTASCGYTGSFYNDQFNGNGLLETQQIVYEGNFSDGKFDGEGHIYYKIDPKQAQFNGIFKMGQKSKGLLKLRDGNVYEGQFQANLPHGNGKFMWRDGACFSGRWQFGVQQGQGFQIEQGKKHKGLWKGGNWIRWI